MPSKKILRCPTKHRMQRLVWSPEYESYLNVGTDDEPIVLVESPFVVETKSDGVDKMVYMCLTTESLLISEEDLKGQKGGRENLEHYEEPEMTTACRRIQGEEEGDWDLQNFRLKYLFPLQHVRLSVRQYREKEGEHVLRLRLGEAEETDHMKTWYLELAGRHRELMWEWWKDWIEELEERRKEQRHRLKVFKKKILSQTNHTDLESIEFGELNLDWHRDNHGLVLSHAASSQIRPTQDLNPGNEDAGPEVDGLKEKREALRSWHIDEHKRRVAEKHPDHGRKAVSTMDILDEEITEADIISRCTQYGVPIPTSFPCSPSFYTMIGLPVPEDVVDSRQTDYQDEINSCSSLEDILSVGSLVDSDVDWHHGVSTEVNDRLVLCVGDLFEKSNVEIHEHGHMARIRPMASDTALVHLLEFEETNLAIDDKHHVFVGIDKEVLHHTHSIPDILEGEAAFLEDDYEASQVTHQRSWVTFDLANENSQLQTHIINGHVLLVTKKELRLEKELIKFRENPHDVDFTTCKHKGKPQRFNAGSRKQKTKKRRVGVVQKFKDAKKTKKQNAKADQHGHNLTAKLKHKLHIGESGSFNKHRVAHLDGHKAVDFLKHNILHVDDLPPWAVGLPEVITITSEEVHPEALARELTLIDKELFLMIHESELVDCMWMKHEKHSKAPNVMKVIEFFERVVRTVSAEIVKRNYDWARAKALAYFTKVAETCLELQNFHSLKAVLCGMQVPSIYRLKYSWSDFEEQYPDEYRSYTEMAHLMADEGCSVDYFARLEKAEKNPPYMSFIGAFLKSLISMFTVKDEGGMRKQHKQKKPEPEVEEHQDTPCAHRGECYHSESDGEEREFDEEDDDDEPFAKLFQKVTDTKKNTSAWVTEPTHTNIVDKSPAYLMNETLFHYQISAIQYKWIDLPQVREFWLRNKLADEVEIWKMSCQKEDVNKTREEKEIRMARKVRIEDEFNKRQERILMRERLAREAVAKTSMMSKSTAAGMTSFASMKKGFKKSAKFLHKGH